MDEEQARRPLSREEFRQLQHGCQLQTRQGRVWTLQADAYLDGTDGEYRVVLVSCAEVLIEKERFRDAYSYTTSSTWSSCSS